MPGMPPAIQVPQFRSNHAEQNPRRCNLIEIYFDQPQIERASPGRVEIKIPALSLPKARDKDGAPAGHWTSSLQRVARRSRGWISADVVAFEFAVEGGAADAEHAAGEGFVAFHLLEDPLDGGTLDIFQIGS